MQTTSLWLLLVAGAFDCSAQTSALAPKFALPLPPPPLNLSAMGPAPLLFHPLDLSATPAACGKQIRPAEPDAFFCKMEYRLAKRTQLPVKFRLGSVEYVDYLEGKPGYWGQPF